ncbi:hypothetical protein BVX99_00460 [bacterium F16]|nr:hypothetical protein BVX99_00460 [bacterium F16]
MDQEQATETRIDTVLEMMTETPQIPPIGKTTQPNRTGSIIKMYLSNLKLIAAPESSLPRLPPPVILEAVGLFFEKVD